MPVNEYCREEGHFVKGLQKGAESFGVSTAAAAVEMLQRMVGVVQVGIFSSFRSFSIKNAYIYKFVAERSGVGIRYCFARISNISTSKEFNRLHSTSITE